MAIIKDEDKKKLVQMFQGMDGDVTFVFFTQEFECQFCGVTREILDELTSISDKLHLETYDFQKDKEKVESYGIDKIPAIAVVGREDYGIRYFGVPSGYEFSSLIEDIIDVSKGSSGLSDDTREKVKGITDSVHIQAFVTQTCPYCPAAVRMAHRLAIESPKIRGDMVGAVEFPHLANKYKVMGVPKVVINDKVEFEGALPEPMFLEKVLEAVGK